MQDHLGCYLESENYKHDLVATRKIWQEPGMWGTAGAFILLSYITAPVLLAVQSPGADGGSGRYMDFDGHREQAFLSCILGLDSGPTGPGGIRNAAVRDLVISHSVLHRAFDGMRGEYMYYLACIIALSPLRVSGAMRSRPGQTTRDRYWRYMRFATSLLNVELPEIIAGDSHCEQFAIANAGASLRGRMLLDSLIKRYPQYVDRVLPALYPATRRTIAILREYPNDE